MIGNRYGKRRGWMKTVFLLLAGLTGLLAVSAAAAAGWSKPWIEPLDPAAAAASSDEYAWRLFVALNWPADPATGRADPARKLGADAPVVWEHWRNSKGIFLKDGADPGPWAGGSGVGPLPAAERFDGLPLDPQVPTLHIVGGVMTPVTDPIASASHLDETRMNRSSFEFIRDWQLYNLDGQLKLYQEGRAVSFPLGARHVKAQWRPIDLSEKTRYYSVEVSMADGSRKLYGLTALHIVSKDLPNWFWATFEHVDNPAAPNAAKWLLKSQDRFACAGLPADCNKAPRGIGLEGTVWQNYRLRGTMTSFVDSRGKPALLANSQLESNVLQTTASCITCHARASIGTVKGKPVRLALFDDDSRDGATRPDGPDNGQGKGFYGWPKPEWFIETGNEGIKQSLYMQLDSVWSLRKAQPRTGH